MKIIKISKNHNVVVEFLDQYHFKKETIYQNFKLGQIRNPYDRTIHGVAFTGYGKYKTAGSEHEKHAFWIWHAIVDRCYNEELRSKYPAYKKCFMCEDWLNYQLFRKWYDDNYYKVGTERMHIDKDILFKNNKIYSPETCIIVPQRINMLFLKKSNKFDLPNGVKPISNGLFSAEYNHERIGIFNSAYEAGVAHDKSKKNAIINVANEYKGKIPDYVYLALINWIPDYIEGVG